MADNLGSIAWLFLQENVLPQWQQKIALRAGTKSPEGAMRLQTGVSPPVLDTPTHGSPVRAKDGLSCLQHSVWLCAL